MSSTERKKPIFLQDSHWIWTPAWSDTDRNRPRVVLFRRKIFLEDVPRTGKIRISADTRYKLYVNERLVEVGPSRGDDQVWFYDTVELLPFLKQGENILGAAVLRYPEEPTAGNHGMFRTPTPGLYVTGYVEDMSGNRYDVSADRSWKCRLDENVSFIREEERFAPLIVHERAAGNPQLFGWRRPQYDDSRWETAQPYVCLQVPEAVSPGNLKPRTIPFMYRRRRQFRDIVQGERLTAAREEWLDFLEGKRTLVIPPHTETTVELDAGEEMTGYIRASFSGGGGAEVSLLYAEAYVQEGFVGPERIPVKTDRTDHVHGHLAGYEDTYRVAGVGNGSEQEIYEPFWFRTFRFVRLQIRTEEESLTLHGLDYEETGYPLKVFSSVQTSDPSLEAVWEISERTLRRCMHETYEDCPYYEQLQYIMDARLQILYTYAVSADDRLARKCMDDLRRSQRYDGLLNCSYPNCNTNVIPGFSIYYILMVYDHMMYFGDRALVEEHMPTIDRILYYFKRHLTPEGYVEKIGGVNMEARFWSFIDWADDWNDTSGMPTAGLKGPLTMETLLYIYGLQHAAELADYLGRGEEARLYRARAERAQEAVRRYCMGKNGMVQDGPGLEEYSQHCQVFALLTDTVDPEQGKASLLKTIEEPGFTQCTVAMRFYLFRALEKTGLYAYTGRYWETWREMVRRHCTTCVESEAYPRSECHAWGSLILYELPCVTLGVRPAAPGYRKVRIAPVPGYMTYASGTVKTPQGEVRVSWKTENGAFKMDYEVPQDMEVVR
ncbi:MAG: glycoside hydrolase family 78 protein [Lachnospiraceae bacterium]|nr:glycoside hydrolase family 78 protein [Lachnospiraceae bacterium]